MISIVIISKDEPSLEDTLTEVTVQASALGEQSETIVVDASAGRLDDIRQRHAATVTWHDFQQPPGVPISIPHQRNAGVRAARGEIIVFTDAGCTPEEGWLKWMVESLRSGEDAVTSSNAPQSTSPSTGLFTMQSEASTSVSPTGPMWTSLGD